MGVRPVAAGPVSTAPVAALNCEPWHGQTRTAEDWSYPTVQPACGHTASKATNFPAVGWITIEGSPVRGSLNDAAPPTGTSLAGPIAVPAGWLPPDPLDPGADVDWAGDGRAERTRRRLGRGPRRPGRPRRLAVLRTGPAH